MTAGALDFLALRSTVSQRAWRRARSARRSSALAPSAAVRTIRPRPLGRTSLRMSRSRGRSGSGGRRGTPQGGALGPHLLEEVAQPGAFGLGEPPGDPEGVVLGLQDQVAAGQ